MLYGDICNLMKQVADNNWLSYFGDTNTSTTDYSGTGVSDTNPSVWVHTAPLPQSSSAAGASPNSWNTANLGWFRKHITIATALTVNFQLSSLLASTLYIDGVVIGSNSDSINGNHTTSTFQVTLAAGNHVIAVRAKGAMDPYRTYARTSNPFFGFPVGVYYTIPDYIAESKARIQAYFGGTWTYDGDVPAYPPYNSSISPTFHGPAGAQANGSDISQLVTSSAINTVSLTVRRATDLFSSQHWDYKWYSATDSHATGTGNSATTIDLTGWTTNQDIANVPFMSNTTNWPSDDGSNNGTVMWYRWNFVPISHQDIVLNFSSLFQFDIWLNGISIGSFASGIQTITIPKINLTQNVNNVIAICASGGVPATAAHYQYRMPDIYYTSNGFPVPPYNNDPMAPVNWYLTNHVTGYTNTFVSFSGSNPYTGFVANLNGGIGGNSNLPLVSQLVGATSAIPSAITFVENSTDSDINQFCGI